MEKSEAGKLVRNIEGFLFDNLIDMILDLQDSIKLFVLSGSYKMFK